MTKLIKAFLPPSLIAVPAAVIFGIMIIGMKVIPPSIPDWYGATKRAEIQREHEISSKRGIATTAAMAAFTIAAAYFFFLPTTIAGLRDCPSYLGILVINVLGSLVIGIGWLVALVWALVERKPQSPQQVLVQNIYHQPPLPPQSEGRREPES